MSKNQITILGIDPGFRATGYAVAAVTRASSSISRVIEIGISRTEKCHLLGVRKTSDDLARAQQQASRLRALIQKHKVDVLAYEVASTTPHTLPTFSFGVMMGVIASLELPIIQVLPAEVKEAVTGDRTATKAQVISWALSATRHQELGWPTSARRNKLGLTYRGAAVALQAEHPADALATIQAALQTEQVRLAATIGGLGL